MSKDISTEFVHGDCIEQMKEMEDENVHAIVTDPPYGLAFMGKSWDDFDPKEYQEWCEEWATEALRVLKPGGHMLAFSGSRTFHRLFVGVEDAGFEVRDTIMWLHGEGFPKGNNISKDIDKNLGKEEEREVVEVEKETSGWRSIQDEGKEQDFRPDVYYDEDKEYDKIERTRPASNVAQKFQGFNTQIKPAFEPVVVARKPLEEDTIAEQVMATGTGALNIDACRISTDENLTGSRSGFGEGSVYGENDESYVGNDSEKGGEGRHPANVVVDASAEDRLDAGNEGFSAQSNTEHGAYGSDSMIIDGDSHAGNQYSDSGGPSRFFYTSKARKSEKTAEGSVDNDHPTVKPVDLMEWLVKLVTAEGQTILDPFLGTGTTMIAAYNLTRNSIGVEMSEEYLQTAKDRVEANRDNPDQVGSYPDHVIDDPLEW